MHENLRTLSRVFVEQVFEIAEIIGFETRNKYRICDENGRDFAFAAEQQKGFLGILLRQFAGHWRAFDIHFFGMDRQPFMVAHHPFRWFFQRLEVRDAGGRLLGHVERRFSFFTKRFDVMNPNAQTLFEISSPLWRLWTFPFYRRGRETARVSKKWSGFGSEIFTDRDNFLVEFLEAALTLEEKSLVLAAALYIDLMFFEHKGNGGAIDLLTD